MFNKRIIHVIEHSAFLKQQKIIEVLREALKEYAVDYSWDEGSKAHDAIALADRIEKEE